MLSQIAPALHCALWVLLIPVLIAAGWFLLNRALSPWRAVRLRKIEPPGWQRREFTGRLRIGAYNIAHGRGAHSKHWRTLSQETILEHIKKIAQLLRDEILDIVVLNEVDFDAVWSRHMNQGEFIARETGFPLWAEQRNIDIALPFARIRYGNVILSHYPILTARRLRFVGHSALESILMGKKEGLLCTIELSAAQRIRVLAVHLEHRQESKRLRAAKMMEEVRQGSPLPLIAAGDFNSTPINFPHATPDKDGQTALSWLLARGAYQTWPSKEPSRDDLTFWSLKPSRVIDWALVPIDWKIISKTVIDRPLSDHKAVVMEIEVNGDPGGH